MVSGRAAALWLGQHHTLVQAFSWLTLWFEGAFALVLLVPGLLWAYLLCGIGFHLGIASIMGPNFSQYVALYSAFVPWRCSCRPAL